MGVYVNSRASASQAWRPRFNPSDRKRKNKFMDWIIFGFHLKTKQSYPNNKTKGFHFEIHIQKEAAFSSPALGLITQAGT